MGKIKEWFSKWYGVIVSCVVAVTLLFALGSCIYTAIVNPFVGIVGLCGVVLAIAICGFIIWREIEENSEL